MCKVLIHEPDESAMQTLKSFFQTNDLIGLKASGHNILEILETNIDLGAIFLPDKTDTSNLTGIELATQIHIIRPELPIFLRYSSENAIVMETQTIANSAIIAGSYTLLQLDKLKQFVDTYLFNTQIPNGLIRGIQEITIGTLNSELKDTEVSCDAPYLIRDKIIYGQVFSLMALESNWCRGYMMLQTEGSTIAKMVKMNKTNIDPDLQPLDFRVVNSVLGEISNRIWGGMKSRFFADSNSDDYGYKVQVPIIINHENRYISFGSEEPQLCLHYRIKHHDNEAITLYQKFVFHLDWTPENFQENEKLVDDFVELGELELF